MQIATVVGSSGGYSLLGGHLGQQETGRFDVSMHHSVLTGILQRGNLGYRFWMLAKALRELAEHR